MLCPWRRQHEPAPGFERRSASFFAKEPCIRFGPLRELLIPAQAYNVIALMASALTPGLGCDPNACDGAESHVCRIVFCVKLSPAGLDAALVEALWGGFRPQGLAKQGGNRWDTAGWAQPAVDAPGSGQHTGHTDRDECALWGGAPAWGTEAIRNTLGLKTFQWREPVFNI